ncbi:MAG: C40 family peptidase [Eggerthellaceae bacterium]|nr:C40 family peptidase [Eggerthellaceae bacterium]
MFEGKIHLGLRATAIAASVCAVACAAAISMPQMAYADYASKQAEADAALETLNIMLAELDQAYADYEAAVIAQEEAEQAVVEAQATIDEKTAVIATNQDTLSYRARTMYRAGSSSFFDVLLGSTTFEEFATNLDALNKLNDNDARVVAETKAARTELEAAKVQLEEERARATQAAEDAAAAQQAAEENANAWWATWQQLDAEAQAEYIREQEAKAAAAAAAAQAEAEAAAAGGGFYDEGGEQVTVSTDDIQSYDESTGTATLSDGSTVTVSSYDSSTGNAIVDRARSAMGSAYVWGGVGADGGGYDCSGLVSYALSGSHTRLGTTHTFMGWNQVSDPQPGDVCVNEGHTGIYVGDGQMIHAADYGIGVIQGDVQAGMIYVRP